MTCFNARFGTDTDVVTNSSTVKVWSLQFFKKPVKIWWLRPLKYYKLTLTSSFELSKAHYLTLFTLQSRTSSFRWLVGVAYVDVMEFTCSMHNITIPGL